MCPSQLPASPGPTRRRSLASLCLRYRAVLFFLAALVVLDVLVHQQRERWARYAPDDYGERLRRCRASAPDLIAVGGSPVTEGIDPALLVGTRIGGRRIVRPFNLGLLGATASEYWHAVKNGVRTPPAVLVYGATASDINDSRQEAHGAHSLMTWSDLADWVRHRPRSAEWVSRHFLVGRLSRCWQLYHHRRAILLWLAERVEDSWPGSFPDEAREARSQFACSVALRRPDGFAPNPGFRERHYDLFKACGGREARFAPLENYRVGEHLRQVYRLIDWCAERGVMFVVVDMPVSEDLSERLHPQVFAAYRRILDDLERRPGMRVLRGARVGAGLTDHDFSDLVHLNGCGADKFSRWLRTRLEELPASAQAPGTRQDGVGEKAARLLPAVQW